MIPSVLTRPGALTPVLVASHPRSGTHLVMDLMRRQFLSLANWRLFGLPLDHLYLNLERLGATERRFDRGLAARIVNRPRRALMKTHFEADFSISWIEAESTAPEAPFRALADAARVIYVVRHPMNVISSYQQFLSGIDPALAGLGTMEFLTAPHWDGKTDRLGWWIRHVTDWAARPGTLLVRYEDVVSHTGDMLNAMAGLLEEPVAGRKPLLPPKTTSIWRTRFDRMVRLSPESTAIVAERSRFPARDWRTELTDADRAAVVERLGPLLARFDYTLGSQA